MLGLGLNPDRGFMLGPQDDDLGCRMAWPHEWHVAFDNPESPHGIVWSDLVSADDINIVNNGDGK